MRMEMLLRRGARTLATIALMCVAGGVSAVEVESGYFAGQEMQPLFGANTSLLNSEPAAVIVFEATQENFDILSKFDAWARQPHQYDYPIYGVVVVSPDNPSDVVEEILRQRGLGFPIFASTRTTLDQDKFELLILYRGEARQLKRADFAEFEKQINKRAAQAGLVPKFGATATTATVSTSDQTSATSASAALRSGPYNNSRFGFRVVFPKDYSYVVSANGDGAVGKAPAGSAMDMRVWAASDNADTQGRVDMADYIKQHLEYIRENATGEVTVERRLDVEDGTYEGRDVIYSYSRRGDSANPQKALIRGRIQIFDVDNVFKCVGVEAPADEYGRSEKLIEEFVESFRPMNE